MQDSGFGQFLLHHPVSDLGVLVMFGAIILGNMGMWKMMDAADSSASPEREMFSTGTETDPVSPNRKRAAAVRKYREEQPNGPFYKMLRVGQGLTVFGAFIMLVGAFI